jgi:CMD domain protein
MRNAFMSNPEADIIDAMVGIAPGSRMDQLRANRREARTHAQASYAALFKPADMGDFTAVERLALASFVTGLHGKSVVAEFYAEALRETGAPAAPVAAIDAEITAGTTSGPYGDYPAGPLTPENSTGLDYRVAATNRAALGPRLVAGMEHAHMLVFHLRDSAAPMLQALLDAGWTTTEIVTLSQLVAFLSFQLRVVTGLRVLASTLEGAQ